MIGAFKRWLKVRKEVLATMDPSRIYVENVRAYVGVNHKIAKWLCEKACRDGLLEHWVSFENPEMGRSLREYPVGEEPEDEVIIDEVAEQLGQKYEFHLGELRRVDFYRGTT